MICAYLDDAGNTGEKLNDPQQPMHFVGAVLVHESRWASVKAVLEEARCIALQKGYPPQEPLEFHGKEVYQGEGHWKKVAFGDRLSIYEKCISAFDVAKVGICYGACDKIKLQRYSKPEHPHNVALWLCLEQIAKYSKSRDSLTLLVADECSRDMKMVTKKCIDTYRSKGAPCGVTVDFSPLIDTIHFMNSHESPHIQLCDMALYVIRRCRQAGDGPLRTIKSQILKSLVSKRHFPY